MKEDFLHYLWKFQKFSKKNLRSTDDELIEVYTVGQHNIESDGPDFFISQILINDQKWAGNVEIHIKSSDWFAHNHQTDINYDSVILHVVWEHDVEVYRTNGSKIPVLELKTYVATEALKAYEDLYNNPKKKWINCEHQLSQVNDFVWENWMERLYVERLEQKSEPIFQLLKENKNNWEVTCFCVIAKAFGGNTNGGAFFKMAQSIPFNIIQKETSAFKLEALFMGQCNMLSDQAEDPYGKTLYNEFIYLKNKYNLIYQRGIKIQFFRLRPPNFPTIRLSQLAFLYAKHNDLFCRLNEENSTEAIKDILQSKTSEYWKTHYNFGVESKSKIKKISNSFFTVLVLNSILPLKFIYLKSQSNPNDLMDELKPIILALKPENNSIVDRYAKGGVNIKSCIHSQALLTLYKNYCKVEKCLSCRIGVSLLNTHEL